MLFASVLSIIMGCVFQGFPFKTAAAAFYSGFNVSMVPGVDPSTVIPQINTLLNRGGLMGMMSTILLIFCAFAFGGIYSKSGCIQVILEKIAGCIRSVGSLIASTVVSTIFMSIVTGSSYLAILVPGEMFSEPFERFGLHKKNLSRTLEDAGTCVVPLVPWAVAGTYMATTLGVPTVQYLPWAVLCYGSFLFALLFGFTGWTIKMADGTPVQRLPGRPRRNRGDSVKGSLRAKWKFSASSPIFMRFCRTENNTAEGAFPCFFDAPKDRRHFCEMQTFFLFYFFGFGGNVLLY